MKGKLLAELKGHTGYVNRVMFSSDGTAIVWPTPEGIMDWLKTAPIPKLTDEEKKELGIADFEL